MENKKNEIKRDITEADLKAANEKYARKREQKEKTFVYDEADNDNMLPYYLQSDFKIKNITLAKFDQLRCAFDAAIKYVREKNVDMDNFQEHILPMSYSLSEYAEIILKTLTDIDHKEIENMNILDAYILLAKVCTANFMTIKNFYGLVSDAIKKTVPDDQK